MNTAQWTIIAIVIGLFALLISYMSLEKGTPSAKIANPASVYCVELGGRLEIESGGGGAMGLCHLPDGSVCEEWALFRDRVCEVPRD